MGIRRQLEEQSRLIDDILVMAGISDRVGGGYVAETGTLFTFTGVTFLDDMLCAVLSRSLARNVVSCPGAVLVDANGNDIAEVQVVADDGEISIMDLIGIHERGEEL